ncbi:MAG: metallophosphoesterase [Chthonomonas sp.]|nr:metallophosphoesterase [Chthonomonas sp.]
MSVTRRQVLGMAAAMAGSASLGYFGESSHELRVERRTLELPRWRANGFKVAVIADIHCNTPFERDRAIQAVRLVEPEKPDVLVMPGDFLNKVHAPNLRYLRAVMEEVDSLGIKTYATLGNHDYGSRGPEIISEVINRSSVEMLSNQSAVFQGVTIAGIDDGVYGMDRHDLFGSEAPDSLITLFHEPDFVSRIDPRTSLMIAGHSHGGQICLPFGLPIFSPYGARRYISGFYPTARAPLFVTRGVGTSVTLNVRLYCPPEVSILTLNSADG